ncbi:MAG TPA: hypothetical protein VJ346_01765 [Bacteroidales bacterium]|nr:hypothetical protein [Bacteroidales bacterium]
MKNKLLYSFIILSLSSVLYSKCTRERKNNRNQIDREVLVTRHTIRVEKFDSLSSLSVGNGCFAFTVDPTGLQSFPEFFSNGINLGTQSEWGWHSYPNTEMFDFKETLKSYDFHERTIDYHVQWSEPERKKMAANYLRQNPHRLHLGIVGLELTHTNGLPVMPQDISDIHQKLDMWSGRIHSIFKIDNTPVEVITCCHQDLDLIAAEIKSPLVEKGQIKVLLKFPYPSDQHVGSGCDWSKPEKHSSSLSLTEKGVAKIERKIDETEYDLTLGYDEEAMIQEVSPHTFILSPAQNDNTFSFSCCFSQDTNLTKIPGFAETEKDSQDQWKKFWNSGGAVDFFGSTNPKAFELERRIILSQYLTRIQCAGNYPPQETGLTFNSWYGKFHLEMHWWHAVHFALWNRIELLEKSLDYYRSISEKAREFARLQGFKGLRWPKMTDPSGNDSPSSIGSFLIWQQPHFIYFAELCFRHHKDMATLRKYADLVFETAEFMASYAHYDAANNRYVLGPALIPAQECFPATSTMNPPFELVYWYWGISMAQEWRERLELERNPSWDSVLEKLSFPAVSDGLYLLAESVPDSYTKKYTHDHPVVLGALGMLPLTPLIDTTIMHSTFNYVWQNWQWDKTWGWDFPMTAMTATRLGLPDKAVDALFIDVTKNTYLINGHNYQDPRLRIYLPGNGGLLTAIAMMCAGYDGCETDMPGFPKDGTWKVRWENLSQMP